MSRQRVAFPSFRIEEPIKPYDMRQLVAALEYRFQSLEEQESTIPDTEFDDDLDGRYAQIIHTHVVADILDFDDHVPSSIFDLDDVNGTPVVGESLIWDGDEFLPGTAGGSLALGELTDVYVPTPEDTQILTWVDANNRWEAIGSVGGDDTDHLIDLVDTDLTTQTAFDLLYNDDGLNWRDTASLLKWNPYDGYLQLANSRSINWLDSSFNSIELLTLTPGAVEVGAAMDYYTYTNYTASSNTPVDSTYRRPTNGVAISQATMRDGEEYLVVHHAMYNGVGGATDCRYRLNVNGGGTLPGAWQQYPSSGVVGPTDLRGTAYHHVGYFTADIAGGDLFAEYYGGSATIYEKTSQTFVLNLTSDVPNHVKARTVTTTVFTGDVYSLSDCFVTLPAGDWMIFYSVQWAGFGFTFSNIDLGLDVDGTYYQTMSRTGGSGDYLCCGSQLFLENYAGGTITISGASPSNLQLYGKTIVAVPMSDFAAYHAVQSTVDSPVALSAGRFLSETAQTLSASIATTGAYFGFGWFAHNCVGTDALIGAELLADVNGGGATLVGYDNDYQHRNNITTATDDDSHWITTDVAQVYTAGDSVDLTLDVSNETTAFANMEYNYPGAALIMLAQGSQASGSFFVGDPAFPTRIDGTLVGLKNNIGINWEDSSFNSVELLTLTAGSTDVSVGVGMDYYTQSNTTYSEITSATYVQVTNGLDQSQATMVNGEEYLVFHNCLLSTFQAASRYRILVNGAELIKSTQVYDSGTIAASDPRGEIYGHVGWFTANIAGANLHAEMHSNSGSLSATEHGSQTFILNLTSDVPNHVKSQTTTTTALNTAVWQNTDCAVTLPAGDWVLFWSSRTTGSGSFKWGVGLDIDGTLLNPIQLGGRVNSASGEFLCEGGMHYLENYAGGDVTMIGINDFFTYNMDYKCIVAVPLSDFAASYAIQADETQTALSAQSTSEPLVTLTVPSIANTGDYIALGWYSLEWFGASQVIGGEIVNDVNSGGDVIIGYSDTHEPQGQTSNNVYFGSRGLLSDTAQTYIAADVVELRVDGQNPTTSWASMEWKYAGAALLQLNRREVAVSDGDFIVGDPVFPTRIDGTLVGLKNSIGINWLNEAAADIELLNFFGDVAANPVSSEWGDPNTEWTYTGLTHASAALNATGILQNTTGGIDVLNVSDDGLHCLIGNSDNTTGDWVRSYTLDSAWDYSNATSDGATQSIINPETTVQWINDGASWMIQYPTSLHTITSPVPYVIDASGTDTGVANSTLGFISLNSISYWMSRDGTKLCGGGDVGATENMRMFELTVPYDITSYSLLGDQQYSGLGGPSSKLQGLTVTEDGTQLYCIFAKVWYYATMSVPFDVTTLTWVSTRNTQTDSGQTTIENIQVTPDGNTVYMANTSSGAQNIIEYNKTIPNTGLEPVAFHVGDPAYPTLIDGTYVGLKNNIGISWDDAAGEDVELLILSAGDDFVVGDETIDTKIDGLTTAIRSVATTVEGTLNVDGAGTFITTLNAQGAVDFDTTLNVDGEASFQDDVSLSATSAINIDANEIAALTPAVAGGDTDWSSVVLLLDFEGADAATAAIDAFDPAAVSTFAANAQLDTAQFKFGTAALLLDGTGDYVQFPQSTALDLAAGDFTVECHLRFNGDPGTADMQFFNKYLSTGSQQSWAFAITNNLLRFGYSTTGADVVSRDQTWNPAGDTWYHVAATRTGGFLYHFVDGVQLGTEIADTGTIYTASTAFTVGGIFAPGLLQEFNGWIDNIRVTKGVARYTTNFTAPTEAYPVEDSDFTSVSLLANLDGADAATSYTSEDDGLRVATFEGTAQLDTAQAKFGTASLLLDGASDWVTFPNSVDFELAAGEYTVECEVRFNGDPGTANMALVAHYNTGSQRSWLVDLNNNELRLIWSTNGTGTASLTTAWNPVGSQWYHVAVTRDSSDDVRFFVDGVLLSTQAGAATYFSPSADLSLGATDTGSGPLNGWIDEVRVTKGVARYVAAFTPPVAAFPLGVPGLAEPAIYIVGDPLLDTQIDGLTTQVTGDLEFLGKLNANVTTVITTTHTAAAEHMILVDDDTAAATVTVTLPTAATAKTIYHIKKLGTTANVIVDGDGTEEIEGALTATLTTQYESIMLISDGIGWHVI